MIRRYRHALQIKAGLEIIMDDIDALLFTFAKIAKRERNTIEIGRDARSVCHTITFGFKVSGYIAEKLRHRERVIDLKCQACAGKRLERSEPAQHSARISRKYR